MTRNNRKKVWLLRTCFLVLCFVLTAPPLLPGQGGPDTDNSPWIAPDDAKKVQNPIKPTPEGLASAAHLYKLNCAGCHGVKGDGKGPAAAALPRKPANFTDSKMMDETTDGELFWKISTGRPPMPTWETLSETQRWELVNYLRTFSAKSGSKESAQ